MLENWGCFPPVVQRLSVPGSGPMKWQLVTRPDLHLHHCITASQWVSLLRLQESFRYEANAQKFQWNAWRVSVCIFFPPWVISFWFSCFIGCAVWGVKSVNTCNILTSLPSSHRLRPSVKQEMFLYPRPDPSKVKAGSKLRKLCVRKTWQSNCLKHFKAFDCPGDACFMFCSLWKYLRFRLRP